MKDIKKEFAGFSQEKKEKQEWRMKCPKCNADLEIYYMGNNTTYHCLKCGYVDSGQYQKGK